MDTAKAIIEQVLLFLSLSDLVYPCVFICSYIFGFIRSLFCSREKAETMDPHLGFHTTKMSDSKVIFSLLNLKIGYLGGFCVFLYGYFCFHWIFVLL